MRNKQISTCWVVSEGLAGTENQCIGVAQALGVPYEIKRVALRQPWRALSPYLGLEQSWSFEPALAAPWPELVIAAGRKSIAASRYIKRVSKGACFTAQIQDPRINASHFDLVAVPEHDPLRGKNVLVTKASPNKVTHDALNAAKDSFPFLGQLGSPRIAVLIGGSSSAYHMTHEVTRKLADDLSKAQGALMVTCSRRTGEMNEALLRGRLAHAPNFFWDGSGVNPYMAMLGWADYILVTADSASMISDACTTGKPVYMIDLPGGSKRIAVLHENLISYGALKRFTGVLEPFKYEALNDAQNVADEIIKRMMG